MPTPNLFDFATRELSQDAFICWLVSWASPALKEHNEALHTTAIAFLDQLLEAGKVARPAKYRSIHVFRQWKHIDVLLLLNENDIAIIIEDKTNCKEHGKQLDCYKKAVRKEYPHAQIAPVYLKTGNQGDYCNIEKAGFGCFLREAFLGVLDGGERAGVKNDIFADFHLRLRRIEEAVQSYKSVPLAKWGEDPHRWQGFFMALQRRLCEGNWETSGHPGGSALPFLWHRRDDKFMRLMKDELSFRIEVQDKSLQAAKWVEWNQALMQQDGTAGVKIKKAPRKLGQKMNVALLQDDYRQVNEQGLLDFDRTIGLLKRAEQLMDAALNLYQRA
jgi:hypothetical protein